MESSNTKVATVNSKGVVTAKAKGTAVITASCGEYKVTCKITVKNPSLKLTKTSATVKAGKTTKFPQKQPIRKDYLQIQQHQDCNSKLQRHCKRKEKMVQPKFTVTCNGVKKVFTVKVKVNDNRSMTHTINDLGFYSGVILMRKKATLAKAIIYRFFGYENDILPKLVVIKFCFAQKAMSYPAKLK